MFHKYSNKTLRKFVLLILALDQISQILIKRYAQFNFTKVTKMKNTCCLQIHLLLQFLTVQQLQETFLIQKENIYISNTKENFKVFLVDLESSTTYMLRTFLPTLYSYSTCASCVLISIYLHLHFLCQVYFDVERLKKKLTEVVQ